MAFLRRAFVALGVLPFLLVAALIIFALASGNFLTVQNLTNVVRQAVTLTIVSLGQMFALLTGGFDLSVGTTLAITSVVGAMSMVAAMQLTGSPWAAIVLGCLGGIAAGTTVGIANGIGVAAFGVSPFIMTLGISSVGFGISLYLTGGVPVYGMPQLFGDVFGFGSLAGIPVPIYFAVGLILLTWLLVNWTRFGRRLYAVGGNAKAAELSGINTAGVLFRVYILCAGLTAVAGMLLTARLDTGEANIGASVALESIAACIIGGVSLRGGVGRVENVVLGSLFIVLVQNGMNLARIESYLQTVVLGGLLILAVVADRIRIAMMASLRD